MPITLIYGCFMAVGNDKHYTDVIMSAMASQITSLTIVYSTVYSGAEQRIHQSSASQAFVRRIHRWPVNSPCKRPVTQKMFPFDDVIMNRHSFTITAHPLSGSLIIRAALHSGFWRERPHRQQSWLAQRWPNLGTTVPTLDQPPLLPEGF